MAINKKLMRRVRNWILAEPLRYEQSVWRESDHLAPCGTAACIGGTTEILLRNDGVEDAFSLDQSELGKYLGLSLRQTYTLFTGNPDDDWPERFAERWRKSTRILFRADRRKVQARIAADYLNSIMKTGKVT